MRAKKEKTEFGSVKAVVPHKKKAFYGTVTPPSKIESSEESKESNESKNMGNPTELEPTEGEANGEAQAESTPASESGAGESKIEMLEKLMEAMQKQDEEQRKEEQEEEKKGEDKEEEKPKEEKSEEEKKQDEQNKQKKEQEQELTKYLTLQLRIRALGEIFGAVKIAQKDKEYFSFTAFAGTEGYVTFKTPPAPQDVIVALSVFPYFETKGEVDDFVELCSDLLIEYGKIAYRLDAQALAVLPTKVTTGTTSKL